MKKQLYFILGLLFIICAFLLQNSNIIRIIILCLGLASIICYIYINKTKNKLILFIILTLFVVFTYGIDYFLLKKFDKKPIYSYEVVSSKKVSLYNSFFYRAYNCNNKIILDNGYKKIYACDENDLDTVDINAFFSETLNSLDKYSGKFIKLSGKVSKIIGNKVIELSAYNVAKDSLNGYVNFNTDYIVRVNVKIKKLPYKNLSQFKIYDNIIVIGQVSTIEQKDNTYLINMVDNIIIPNENYDSYTIDIIEDDSKEANLFVEKNNYYTLGISNIFVHYSKSDIYELSYLITDERMTIDDLIEDIEPIELKNEDEELVAKEYKLKKFNIIKCENEKVIFANKKRKINLNICE